ncbi:MAG: DUF58 domain-containing protein [Pseudomonas sp.]|uniref:DUF58 domain-containing protein n=1 Tax=Pseudomonas sp. TaxID=306 RepID=UPI003BB7E115
MRKTPVAWWSAVWERHANLLILSSMTLVAYFAAISRLQPLLWAIAALLSATLLTGVLLPGWLVRRLSVARKGPSRATEGETISFAVVVENHGLLPRFMVELVDRLPFLEARPGTDKHGEKKLGLLAYVPGGSSRRFEVALLCEQRGFYRLGPAGLASSFPLGLTEARQLREGSEQTLTIYPDVFPIVEMPLHGSPSQIHRGNYLLPENAGSAEFSGLREYRRGDNPRHVHWPTTARLNELMIKEFEPLASACLYIVLDQAADANVGQGRQASFEYAVRIAASMAKFACGNNIPTRLLGQGQTGLYQPAGTGQPHYLQLLDELAVVAADGVMPYATLLQKIAQDCQRGETVVLFIGEPKVRLAETLKAVALLRAGGVNVLAMVFARQSFSKPARAYDDSTTTAMANLLALGATCLEIKSGADLLRLFNA